MILLLFVIMFLCGLVGGFLIELFPVKGGAFISGFLCFLVTGASAEPKARQ